MKLPEEPVQWAIGECTLIQIFEASSGQNRSVRFERWDVHSNRESRVSINTSENLSKSVRLLLENRKIVSKFFDSSIICFCYFNPTVKPICWKFAFQWRNVSIETFDSKVLSENLLVKTFQRTLVHELRLSKHFAIVLRRCCKRHLNYRVHSNEKNSSSVLKIDEFSIQKFWIKTLSKLLNQKSLSGWKMSNRVALSKSSLGICLIFCLNFNFSNWASTYRPMA